jgi:DUF1365 family protein
MAGAGRIEPHRPGARGGIVGDRRMTVPSHLHSAIYLGHVVHTRLKPVHHRLRHRMLTLLLDLDELPRLAEMLSLFSVGQFNLFGFHGRDHLAGDATPLREQVERELRRGGIEPDGGPIRLLAMPRMMGTVFNPLSIFFCHAADGSLQAVLYEVNNTFGQRHSYLIPVSDPDASIHRQECEKRFYVSPFMEMEMRYRFRLRLPGRGVSVAIEARDANGAVMTACLTGSRQDLTDRNLLRALPRHPMLAAQVLGGIHWEALKLWRKGMKPVARPNAPRDPVTIVHPERRA